MNPSSTTTGIRKLEAVTRRVWVHNKVNTVASEPIQNRNIIAPAVCVWTVQEKGASFCLLPYEEETSTTIVLKHRHPKCNKSSIGREKKEGRKEDIRQDASVFVAAKIKMISR